MDETTPSVDVAVQPLETVEPVQAQPKQSNAGRPTVVDAKVLQKLEQAFLMGCTDTEACFIADIAPATLYNYQKEHPEFLERKEQLKQNPIIKARNTVYNSLDDTDTAKWYLERKRKAEFATRQELTGGDKEAAPLKIEYVSPIDTNPAPVPSQDQVSANVETTPGVDASNGQ